MPRIPSGRVGAVPMLALGRRDGIGRQGTRLAVACAIEDHPIGPVLQAVEGRGGQQFVGKGAWPLAPIQVARDEAAAALIAFGDEVAEVLVLGGSQRTQTEIIDDDEVDPGELLELAVVALRGARRRACVANTTSKPWRNAQCPRAWARWLLPVPVGPTIKTGAFSVTNRPVARSAMSACGAEGLAAKSKRSRVLSASTWDLRRRWANWRCSRRATSSWIKSARKSV